jgi:hypothetical protein
MGKSDLAIQNCPILRLKPRITSHCGSEQWEVFMFQEVQPVELRARCDPELRQKIKEAAEEAVRSMSAEIAYRLEKSFEHDNSVRITSPT